MVNKKNMHLIGRCLESLGIAVIAGAIVAYAITKLEYWYFLFSGSATVILGIVLQKKELSFIKGKLKNRKSEKSYEQVRLYYDWWKTWFTALASIIFTLLAICLTLFSSTIPLLKDVASRLSVMTIVLVIVGMIVFLMFGKSYLDLKEKLEK